MDDAGGLTVLGDLSIPVPGVTANIDHVLVEGRFGSVRTISVIVTKAGKHWSLAVVVTGAYTLGEPTGGSPGL